MKLSFAIILLAFFITKTSSQTVEIQGQAKISQMGNDNTIDDIVIRKPDGTLGTRSASSLPVNNPDTTRNLSTDFELAKHICDCGNNLPPFMIESLLANGYTKEDLLRAGVPFTSIESQDPILDGDGNVYTFVTIGNQRWLKENLKTTTYSDGTAIPNEVSDIDWENAGINENPAYSWYGNNISNKEPFGALYNWFVVDSTSNGTKNVCPSGWHVPTKQDQIDLMNNLDSYGIVSNNIAGSKLKEVGFVNWGSLNSDATNTSGFTAVGGGLRLPEGGFSSKSFLNYLHSRESSGSVSIHSTLSHQSTTYSVNQGASKALGRSVRCVQIVP